MQSASNPRIHPAGCAQPPCPCCCRAASRRSRCPHTDAVPPMPTLAMQAPPRTGMPPFPLPQPPGGPGHPPPYGASPPYPYPYPYPLPGAPPHMPPHAHMPPHPGMPSHPGLMRPPAGMAPPPYGFAPPGALAPHFPPPPPGMRMPPPGVWARDPICETELCPAHVSGRPTADIGWLAAQPRPLKCCLLLTRWACTMAAAAAAVGAA